MEMNFYYKIIKLNDESFFTDVSACEAYPGFIGFAYEDSIVYVNLSNVDYYEICGF